MEKWGMFMLVSLFGILQGFVNRVTLKRGVEWCVFFCIIFGIVVCWASEERCNEPGFRVKDLIRLSGSIFCCCCVGWCWESEESAMHEPGFRECKTFLLHSTFGWRRLCSDLTYNREKIKEFVLKKSRLYCENRLTSLLMVLG